MRSNGLTAAAYTPVADLSTVVVTVQLQALRSRGVAAWAEPLGSGRERLFVDASEADAVQAELADTFPDAVRGDDLTWARIVAGYDTDAIDPVARWPVPEDDDGVTAADVDLADDPDDVFDPDWNAPLEPQPVAPEDRYVPPEPEPLPVLDPIRTAAWIGVIAGPAVLVIATFASLPLAPWVGWLAAGAFTAGFLTLVRHMRTSDETPHDPDDGAVV